MSQPMNSQGSNQAASNSNYQQVLQPVNNPPPHQPRPYTQPMPGSQYQQRVGAGPHRVLTVNRYEFKNGLKGGALSLNILETIIFC